MSHRLIPSETYETARARLSANARVALPYALERIADNPYHHRQRMFRYDGSIVDYGAEGLLIAYEVLDHERVRLLGVIDVKKEHRWA